MATVSTSTAPPAEPVARTSPPLLELLKGAWTDPTHRASIVGAVASLGLLAILFWVNLVHFIQVWSTDENYSHGFLVPFLSLFFANEAARRGPVAVLAGIRLGSSLIAVGLGIKLATILIPFPAASDYGFILALAGLGRLPGRERGRPAVLVRSLLSGLHGPLARRALHRDRQPVAAHG